MNAFKNTNSGLIPALKSGETFTAVYKTDESDAMKLPRIFAKYSSLQELVSGLMAVTGALAIVASMAACQPKNGANPSADGALESPAFASAPAAGTGSPRPRGTGDSGGGNGLDGAFLEAYSFEPTDRPEFKSHMGPVMEHLSKLDSDNEALGSMLMAARAKRWYLVDSSFDRLTNEQIGLGFLQDPTQQLARQSDKEIWFDQKKFESKPDQAQGLALCQDTATRDACVARARTMGIVHEMLMAQYMTQFMSLTELCTHISPATDCTVMSVLETSRKDLDFAAKPKRVLNEKDYSNIRSMTVFMVDQAIRAESKEQIRGEFRRNGFDMRMMSDDLVRLDKDNTYPYEIKLSREQFIKSLTAASVVGRVPSTCRIAKGKVAFVDQCPVAFNVIQHDGEPTLEATIALPSVQGGMPNQTIRLIRPIHTLSEETFLNRTSLPGQPGQGYRTSLGFGIEDSAKVAIGTEIYDVTVYLSQDGLSVNGVWLTAQQITRVKTVTPVMPRPNAGHVATFELTTAAEDLRRDVQIVSGTIESNSIVTLAPSRLDAGFWFKAR